MPQITRGTWAATATRDSVPVLRTALCEFALEGGVPEPPLEDMKLAVSEAVTNVVLHSYRDRTNPGPVEIEASLGSADLRVVVSDEGMGMGPRHDSPGGGFGLPIIAAVTDSYEVRSRRPEGTEMHLCFNLAR